MALVAEDWEQGESLRDRVSLRPCQADQDGDRGSNRRSPGGKVLCPGREMLQLPTRDRSVTPGGLRSPSPTRWGCSRSAWPWPQLGISPRNLQYSPVSPPRAGRCHKLPGLSDERSFLRVIKPSPLGTMGPYPAVSFT